VLGDWRYELVMKVQGGTMNVRIEDVDAGLYTLI